MLATGELAPEGLTEEALGLRARVARVRQARDDDDRARMAAMRSGYARPDSKTGPLGDAFHAYWSRAGGRLDEAMRDLRELRARQPDWGRLGAGQPLLDRARLVVDALRRRWDEAGRIVASLLGEAPAREAELAGLIDRVLNDLPEDGPALGPVRRAVEQEDAGLALAERLAQPAPRPTTPT